MHPALIQCSDIKHAPIEQIEKNLDWLIAEAYADHAQWVWTPEGAASRAEAIAATAFLAKLDALASEQGEATSARSPE